MDLLKTMGFAYRSETLSNVVYSNQLPQQQIEQFIFEFASVWGSVFSVHLDDHILSLPTENPLLTSTVDLLNENIEIKIEIKKSGMVPPHILCNYNVHIFSQANLLINNLKGLNFAELEHFIFNKRDQQSYIIIYDDTSYSSVISNNFIAIGNIDVFGVLPKEPEKYFKESQDKIKERNDNIRWNQEICLLPPEVFYFDDDNSNEISEFLNKQAAAMCVAFTASNTDYLEGGKLYQSTYFGLKQTKFQLVVADSCTKEQINKIFSLYSWAYSVKPSDKIGLIQNIINLHIKEDNNSNLELLFQNAAEIVEMVRENYRVYIQKSVKSYLDERKQVEDFIRTTSNEISKQISGLTDIVTKNLFGLLATAITATIGFNKPENQAYIPWILYIYGFFSTALTVYYSTLANANKKVIIDVYEKRVKDYKKIFLEDRIDQITGNSIEEQISIFKRYLHWTVWPSIGISLIGIIVGLKFHGLISWMYLLIKQLIDKIIALIT
ncbi:hypothetical protein [Paenibacillus sp. CECT 9249]|uniref:hypothetical protein n=1 Tax=Paenibacillus sp. CECT 9249 TaxID=2845385 RepID=UPI001E4271CD|nr:hypothetical protein [Paenibacillus sp. CECT 9249]